MTVDRFFTRPTSVVIYGVDRPFLSWVAYAWTSAADREYAWVDVRLRGEVRDENDPVVRNMIPADRLSVVYADELQPQTAAGNIAIAGVVRDEESSDAVRRLVDFLQLPSFTQQLLSQSRPSGLPWVLVFSNAHRVVASFPTESVVRVVRGVVEAGAILLSTFADAPPEARHAFETILHLEGGSLTEWRHAVLRVEKAPAEAPYRVGSRTPLGDVPPVAEVLSRILR